MNIKVVASAYGSVIVPHPCDLYESENLNAVEYPELKYRLSLPCDVIDGGALSSIQVDTIRRVCQSLQQHSSFLLGDGTGTGKGRVLASVAWEFLLTSVVDRIIWISANKGLFKDANRDTTAISGDKLKWGCFQPEDNLCFASYNDFLNEDKYALIKSWIDGSHRKCLIMLDECHILRHVSKLSFTVSKFLADIDPSSLTVYSSATAASSPSHFRYATQLGLWGKGQPFPDYQSFYTTLNKFGSSAMELVAFNLKASGKYVSRHLGFENVEVSYEKYSLSAEDAALYNFCSAKLLQHNEVGGMSHQMFWQRFIASIKIKKVVEIIKRERALGNAVIVALQNTGEASDKRMIDTDNPQCISSCQDIMSHVFSGEDFFLVDPIDAIIHEFGVDMVAEITGRTRRVVVRDGIPRYETKPPSIKECNDFQSGKKGIVVLSRAGSMGISLHADQEGRLRGRTSAWNFLGARKTFCNSVGAVIGRLLFQLPNTFSCILIFPRKCVSLLLFLID